MTNKKLNPNQRPDPFPSDVRPGKNDPSAGSLQKHERDISRLDRSCPPEKGGRAGK
jgi:hypothetical protein